MENREYSVSEAVQLTGVPSHVLRYWEEELQIAIKRTSLGHRVYSEENLRLFRQVKEWKEKGIQLKAIRVLLHDTNQDPNLTEKIREIAGEEESDAKLQEEPPILYEVVPAAQPSDQLRQFERILRTMLEEVVIEQNEKLEQKLTAAVRDEIEELYLQYLQLAMEETAAARSGRGIAGWLEKIFHRK